MTTNERLPPHKMSVDFRRSVAIADLISEQKGRDGLLPTIAQIILAIRASDEAAGMVLVPREATENMQQAGEYAWMHRNLNNPNSNPLQDCYRAMLAAATESDNG